MRDTNLSVTSDAAISIRAGSDAHQVENVAFFADGALIAQGYDGWLGPLAPYSPDGFRVVTETKSATVHLDPARLPAGDRTVIVSVQTVQPAVNPKPPHIVRLEAGTVPLRCTQPAPTLAATTIHPPVFRDPRSGRPVFVRGVFGAHADELIARPGLPQSLRDAGVNCLFVGAGVNTPRDLGATAVIPDDAFATGQNRHWAPLQQVLAEYPDWLILGDGMDWTYEEAALEWLDFASDAALTAWFRKLKSTRRMVGLDLCDETASRLSESMRERMARLTRLARQVGLSTAYTTNPNLQAVSPPRWYEGMEFCDYLSYGIDSAAGVLFRPAALGAGGAWSVGSVDQYAEAMDQIRRNPYVRTDCPRLQNVTLCGGPLIPPHLTLSQIGAAICSGAVGVKMYHFDTLAWKENRQVNPLDQIGADPTTNPDRWAAMSHAFALIAEHEDRILQWAAPVQHTLGRWWLTRETHGPAGRFWLAVNRLEGSQITPPVPAWATRVEAVTPTGRVVAPTEVPAGSWLVATG